MIHFLRVRNLAIVEEFAIEPGDGFNVLTGETGAGKSLLIDSLELLSGARSSADSIRSGADRLQAEAALHLSSDARARLSAAMPDLFSEADDELIVRRELASNGRGKVTVNGSPIAVRELAQMMDELVEIHGQSATRDRIAGQTFREVLDHFAECGALRSDVETLHQTWSAAADALNQQKTNEQNREIRIDQLRFELNELEGARLVAGEEEQLREERAVLANSEALMKATATAWNLLEEDEASVSSNLARARSVLAPLSGSVQEIRLLVEQLDQASVILAETGRDVGRLAENLRHDPERLDQIESRLALLERLRRKYGRSTDELIGRVEVLRTELAEYEDLDSRAAKLRAAEENAFAAWKKKAEELSSRRSEAAPRLAVAIRAELRDLAMEKAQVEVIVGRSRENDSRLLIEGEPVAFGPLGYDRIDIHIAANPGEQPRPLSRVASGGELSRMQLAIASAMFRRRTGENGATLVFDEIDTGVGGRVAEAIGRKLRDLSASNQVICVTHLPQIAALADVQFRVWKEESGQRTTARIARLDSRDERVNEIARMLGGEAITETARAHARELLAAAEAAV